ncbi:MAG: 2-oxoisovalerate dehydrogenase [Deltaproteobacteria bacterium]|nr:2-oxoisovalerate dehydrogenase [Deltaproteobacteria bacterium]
MTDWYRLLFLTRELDDRASVYIRRGMGWSFHARCSGQEGIQIALGMAFRRNKDFLFPYYRDTGTVLGAGMDPKDLFLNGLSCAEDPCSGGRHMSNHFGDPKVGIQNVSSCTGNHTLHAAGVARAIKAYDDDGVAFSSQGESSASEGYVFEAINGAAREKLPVVFVIQNNGYGISVPTNQATGNWNDVGQNFSGLKNLKVITCDGTDIFDSVRGMNEAVAHVNAKKGPVVISAQCVRMGAHSNSDAQNLYRNDEEVAEAGLSDPVKRMRAHMVSAKVLDDKKLETLEAEVHEQLDVAASYAESAAKPTPQSNELFVTPPAFDPVTGGADTALPTGDATEKLREAVNRTLKEEFRKNEHTFLWGQDVASKDKGGVFNLTKGMLQEFGSTRVFNGPIAEDFIVGTANGLCRYRKDIRVVIEAAQFADYVWPAMEQIVECSHDYWRSNGQYSPNITCRLASGGYITGGLYHSQNVEAIMSHLPGLRVMYPTYADDAAGLLRTCLRSEGMNFFLEPKYLYNRPEAKGPPTSDNYAIPFGKGRVRHAGTDLSVITYGNTTHMCVRVAEKLAAEGLSVEVFDLRCIKPLDEEGIYETVRKTGKALVVHEDHLFNGIGSEVAGLIAEHCFQDLDGPVRRLAAKDIPIGFSKILENETLPQHADIEAAMRSLLSF